MSATNDKDLEKGLALAFIAALISGISVFANGMAVKLADATVYTLAKNVGALIFLIAIVFALKEWRSFRSLSRKQWLSLIAIGIIGGSVPFAMFFYGLKLEGAAISSFIYRSLFVFAGVFGYLLLKEKPDAKDMAAALAILAGNAFLVSGGLVFGTGQLLVLGATMLWALEYTVSRKVMADVAPKVVMVSRMLFGGIVLLGFLLATGSAGALFSVASDPTMLLWLGITSLLLTAFMMSWYSSLKYLPVMKAASVFALGGIVTAVLEFAFLGKSPSANGAVGLLLISMGAVAVIGIGYLERALESVLAGARRALMGK